jgi:hypothetical protein
MSIKSWAVAVLELEPGYVRVVGSFARTGKCPILYRGDYQLSSHQNDRQATWEYCDFLFGRHSLEQMLAWLGRFLHEALMHVLVAPPFCPLPPSASLSPCHLTRPLRLHNATGSGRSAYFNLSPKLRVHLCGRFEGVQKTDEERHRRS